MKPYIHYNPEHTSSYNADLSVIRLLFALAASHKLHATHLDIEGAYLHERYKHNQPVYVRQMPKLDGTYLHPECSAGLLIGNIYGGKNSSNTYLTAAFQYIKSKGYTQSHADPCLFSKHTKDGFILFAITTDDFLVVTNHKLLTTQLISALSDKYRVKNLGTPTGYLGWTVKRFKDGAFFISQPDYIHRAIAKMRMTAANGKATPYPDGIKLHRTASDDQPLMGNTEVYRSILGDLRYITDSTRPDIHYITGRLAAALSKPTQRHWQALKSLIRYLKQTQYYGIYYPATPTSTLTAYSDADHAADIDTRKSITGTIHLYNGAPVSWTSQKQTIHALSTCEAEYIAATTATQHTQWLRRILAVIQYLPPEPTKHLIDNQAAILVAKSSGPTRRRKYIELRRHYLHEHIRTGHITVHHVPSKQMLADALTKPLKRTTYTHLISSINILSPNHATERSTQKTKAKRSPRDWGSEAIPIIDSRSPIISAPRIPTPAIPITRVSLHDRRPPPLR